jgi:hypothetical protein
MGSCSGVLVKVGQCYTPLFLAPIATSRNNVYITWSSNKTTENFEIMFRPSNGDGATFRPILKLASNSTIGSSKVIMNKNTRTWILGFTFKRFHVRVKSLPTITRIFGLLCDV